MKEPLTDREIAIFKAGKRRGIEVVLTALEDYPGAPAWYQRPGVRFVKVILREAILKNERRKKGEKLV